MILIRLDRCVVTRIRKRITYGVGREIAGYHGVLGGLLEVVSPGSVVVHHRCLVQLRQSSRNIEFLE